MFYKIGIITKPRQQTKITSIEDAVKNGIFNYTKSFNTKDCTDFVANIAKKQYGGCEFRAELHLHAYSHAGKSPFSEVDLIAKNYQQPIQNVEISYDIGHNFYRVTYSPYYDKSKRYSFDVVIIEGKRPQRDIPLSAVIG